MRPADAARLIALAAIWGSSFLLIKIALEDMGPIELVFGRLVVGAATLLVLLRARGVKLPGREALPSLIFMATVANILPFALIAYGEEHITSSLAAILNSTTPLFTAVLATMFLTTERMTVVRAGGIVLGFVGVAVIVGVDTEGGLIAQLAIVGASASYGIGFVYARSKISGRFGSPLSLSAAQILVATTFMTPIAVADIALGAPSLTRDSVLAIAALGAGGTGIAYLLYYQLVQDVGATTASFVTYLIPLFGIVLGTLFLDEEVGWNVAIGAGLVIAGIAIAEKSRAASIPQPAEIAACDDA